MEIEGDIATLEEALRRFTGTEVLDGENKYQCSRLAMFLNAFENTYFLYAMQFLSKKKEKRRTIKQNSYMLSVLMRLYC